MKNDMKSKRIECEVFKCGVELVWNCEVAGLEKMLKKKKIIGKDADLSGLEGAHGAQPTFIDEQGVTRVLWLKQWKNKAEDIGRLAHEVSHLVIRICDWKGVPFDGDRNNDETFAYLVDYFVIKALTELNKK